MGFRGLLAVLALASLALGPVLGAGSRKDAELLLEFKASFTNGIEVLPTWLGEEPCKMQLQNPDAWQGITCSPGGDVIGMLVHLSSCLFVCKHDLQF
jgi:hypothetical protein